MTYEEWGEINRDCWNGEDDLYADWTADREVAEKVAQEMSAVAGQAKAKQHIAEERAEAAEELVRELREALGFTHGAAVMLRQAIESSDPKGELIVRAEEIERCAALEEKP